MHVVPYAELSGDIIRVADDAPFATSWLVSRFDTPHIAGVPVYF
jgi:hypothetical protein